MGTLQEEDEDRARSMYAKAATKGHGAAKRQLGTLLMTGVGGEPNVANAVMLWNEAAGLGDNESAQYLTAIAAWAKSPDVPWNTPNSGTATTKDPIPTTKRNGDSALKGLNTLPLLQHEQEAKSRSEVEQQKMRSKENAGHEVLTKDSKGVVCV